MTGKEKGLLWVAHGGMELSWLYAWANFALIAIWGRPFSLPAAMGTFLLAALLTVVVEGRGWRIIVIFAAQLTGFVIATSGIVYTFTEQNYPYFGFEWVTMFFTQPRTPIEWIILGIIFCFAILFWVSGITLVRRPDTYFKICNRADLGMAAFLGLFLLKFLLRYKGGIHIRDPISELSIFPFFIFSLMAISIANSGSGVQKDFLSGFRGIGLSLTFSVIVLGFGAALVFLFLPYLTMAAEVGYGVLKITLSPLGPIMISILRFMFSPRRSITDTRSQSSGGDELNFGHLPEESWWTVLIGKIFSWSLIGMVMLVALIVCLIGLWYLLRWLLSKSAISRNKQKNPFPWLALFKRFRDTLRLLRQWFAGKIKGYENGAQLFGAVMRWGRRSGLPRFDSETPLEYAFRLKNNFPFLKKEIQTIVAALNQELYAEKALKMEEFRIARMAWRKLSSPRYWPVRFKSWFFSDSNPDIFPESCINYRSEVRKA
ncbi:MAG: DUF4129 domain-containing protein [Deltaproteobacteria bacterium]|nr:DUF4129 domain-containing protein [Deltaproteobacteria bacterium]